MQPHRQNGNFTEAKPLRQFPPHPSDDCQHRQRINPLPNWRLRRVLDHVRANITEPLSLAELAAAAGLSRMYFAAQFRAAMGVRPHEYLLRQRVLQAMVIMLAPAQIPLAELALAAGFQSQSHFSTVFKRFTGETPAAWRRENRSRAVDPTSFCLMAAANQCDALRAKCHSLSVQI